MSWAAAAGERGHGDPELGSRDVAHFSQSHKTQDHREDKMEMRSQEERRQLLLTLGEGIEACLCTAKGHALTDGVPESTLGPCALTKRLGPVPGPQNSLPNVCLRLIFV